MDLQAILRQLESNRDWIKNNLRELVEQESPSEDRPSVNAAMVIAERIVKSLGGRTKRHKQKIYGDVLELHSTGPSRSPHVNHCFYWDISTRSGLRNVEKDAVA